MKFQIDQINNDLFKVFVMDDVDTCHFVTLKDDILENLLKKK